MFNFMKKDRLGGSEEKSGKKKEDKKKEKKEKKKDRALTTEDLNRLEEVRRSYFGRKIKKKKEEGATSPTGIDPDDSSTASISPACSPNSDQNNHKNNLATFGLSDNREPPDSDSSIGGGGPVLSSLGGGVITLMSNYSSQSHSPNQQRPQVPPKPPQRGILKGASNYSFGIGQGVKGNIDDEESVMENTQANENIIYDVPSSARNGLGRPLPPLPSHQLRTESPADVSTSSEYSSATQSPMRSPNVSVAEMRENGEPGENAGEGRCLKNYSTTFGCELKLPPISRIRQPKVRTLTIARQPAGDFGFCLRRAFADAASMMNNDLGAKRKEVLFAEPKEFNRNNPTGLLPGDQLLEVNGTVVTDKSREEVADLIRTSGDNVTLLVRPVPELSELTVRSSSDGTEVELDERHIKTGTLTRSGSRRFKKGDTAKSEHQLASEKAWLDDQKVWLVHQNGYTGAMLVAENGQDASRIGEIDLGKAKVKLEQNEQIVEVEEEDVEKANPSQFDQVEDLSQLRFLNESSALHALRQRYASSLIHTYAGNSSMIIINPMRPLSIYTEKVIQMFRGCKRDDMPPHVYAVAQSAYRNMVTSRIDQSIVLTGRSGSGKTVNFQHILTYLSHTVGSVNKILTVEKLKAIFVLLEYFGHCHTKLNGNATRYTLIFSLDFDHSGQIANASLQAFMLDRSRLIRGRVNEMDDTYKIFKHMLNGMDDKQKRELYLETLATSNFFFGPQIKEDAQQANFHWARAQSSFELLGVKEEDSKAIWSVLAAIYHLGAAGVENGPNGKGQFKNPQGAQKAASLLGTTIEQLARAIFQSGSGFNGSVGGSLGPPSRNAFRTSPTDRGQSEAAMDAMEALQGTVIGLYCETFNAVISLINKSISSNSRTANSILVLDTPGFKNPGTCDGNDAASFEDLCNNYIQERLQLLFHDHVIVAQHDKYTQEKIEYSQNDLEESSPLSVVNLIDKPSQQGLMRSSNLDLRNADHKGLLWLLDEEAIFPGSNDETFLERLFMHNSSSGNGNNHIFKTGRPHHFVLPHLLGTNMVEYDAKGWLKACRENVNIRSAILLLQESQKNNISRLFVTSRGPLSMTVSGSVVGIEGTTSLRRASSIRRAFTTGTASIKRKSLCLQVKFQVDGIVETLRRTRLHFVHCILPQHDAGLCGDVKTNFKTLQSPTTAEEFHLNIPLLRSQLRGTQILDAVRLNKQGFPDHMLYSEFKRRFELLGPPELKEAYTALDEKKTIETLMGNLDIDKTQYKLGLSQIFFRTGALVQLEEQRDERLQDTVVKFQSFCRGYLARKKFAKRKIQELAIRCIQRNVRKFMVVRSWPWWRLLVRVLPLLNVHRTEEELKSKTEELETLRLKVEKIERERNELKHENNKLEAKVSELTADLAEEHATSTHASEMLEAEMSERMRMDKELQETNNRFCDLQRVNERVEMEVMELRMMKATDMNGDLSGDEDGENSVYKQRYDNTRRELELIKKKMKQQIEDDQEQMMLTRKTVERKFSEAVEEADIQRQAVNQWKRKVQRLNQEMNDIKYMLEEQTTRNAALEKKQRKFDVELSAAVEQVRQEKLRNEKFQKERDQIMGERYTLEQELESVKLDMEMKNDKLAALTKELDDLTFGSKGDEEIAQLKRAKHEMELKLKEQEEELDDLAGQVSMLEQAKLRLEMNFENVRKEHRKELSQKDEEIEETRASCQKKLKLLEHQLETEHEDRQALIREKHELERKLFELQERPMVNQDAETVSRLRKDLKRTKALLKDAQLVLERNKGDSATKAAIRQLKNQLEDAEFGRTAAIKSKQSIELELQESQSQLDDVTKVKSELEKKVSVLAREKADLQVQMEENEEELAEVMRKYKASVTQLSVDQTQLAELAGQVSDLEVERNMLRDQMTELTGKLEQLEGETVSSHEQKRLEMKVKEMETRLELEATTRGRLEVQLNRVRETLEKVIQECDSLRAKEQQAQEANRKLQRQLRDAKEDYAVLQQKELEINQRRHEMELSLETSEVELQTARSDLKLALKRIEDLQAAMEDNGAESDDSEGDSDGDSSDTSVESFLLSHRVSQPSLTRSRLTSSGNSSFYSSSTFGRTNSLGEVDVVSRSNHDEDNINESQPKVKLSPDNHLSDPSADADTVHESEA